MDLRFLILKVPINHEDQLGITFSRSYSTDDIFVKFAATVQRVLEYPGCAETWEARF
jgi:hypothetical protein